MPKKPNYAALYTLRADGRYQGYWRDADGKRHALCDRDPARLYEKLAAKELPAEKPHVTFQDAAQAWRDVRFEQLAYKTAEAYKPVFRRLTARFGAEALEAIETRDVSAYLQALASQGYARRTVQMHRDMIGQIYNHAIGAGLTRNNPVDHASMPRGLAAGTRGIAPDEAIEAVKNGLGQPFGLFAFVCLYAGLRRGEALALRYEDVDREAGYIHITKAVEYLGNTPHLKEPKTASGRRDVYLLDVLADAIPKQKSGYIFAGDDGDLLSKMAYRVRWERYCTQIGYTITAHQLRHGYATILYEADVPDKDAQEQLGHSSIEVTRNVYTHVRAKQRDRTRSRLNRYLATQNDAADEGDVVKQILDLLEGQDAAAILAQVAAKLTEQGAR